MIYTAIQVATRIGWHTAGGLMLALPKLRDDFMAGFRRARK